MSAAPPKQKRAPAKSALPKLRLLAAYHATAFLASSSGAPFWFLEQRRSGRGSAGQRGSAAMSDAKRIKELLRERVAELAPYLFPNGKREGNHWCVGSINGEAGRSFKICIAGPEGWLVGRLCRLGKAFSKSARSVDGGAEL